jgi:hypothetical protein
MANETGNYRTTRERDQRAFDQLPPDIRRALNYTYFDFAAEPLLDEYKNRIKQGFSKDNTTAHLVDRIQQMNEALQRDKEVKALVAGRSATRRRRRQSKDRLPEILANLDQLAESRAIPPDRW